MLGKKTGRSEMISSVLFDEVCRNSRTAVRSKALNLYSLCIFMDAVTHAMHIRRRYINSHTHTRRFFSTHSLSFPFQTHISLNILLLYFDKCCTSSCLRLSYSFIPFTCLYCPYSPAVCLFTPKLHRLVFNLFCNCSSNACIMIKTLNINILQTFAGRFFSAGMKNRENGKYWQRIKTVTSVFWYGDDRSKKHIVSCRKYWIITSLKSNVMLWSVSIERDWEKEIHY